MKFKDLTDEQRSKFAGAKGPEDILAMAREEGYELTDEELEAISGGGFWSEDCYCPKCGSHNVGVWKELDDGHCYDCDFEGCYDQFWQ